MGSFADWVAYTPFLHLRVSWLIKLYSVCRGKLKFLVLSSSRFISFELRGSFLKIAKATSAVVMRRLRAESVCVLAIVWRRHVKRRATFAGSRLVRCARLEFGTRAFANLWKARRAYCLPSYVTVLYVPSGRELTLVACGSSSCHRLNQPS